MEEKLKYIKYWLLSFIILAADFVIFMYCFYYERALILYVICAIVLALFCVFYVWSNKKITCEDGYNLVQAFFFFRRCSKTDIITAPDKLSKKQLNEIAKIAKEYDYSKDFDLDKVKTLYSVGYTVAKEFKNEIKKRSKDL